MCLQLEIISADVARRETQRNAAAKTQAIEHKKRMLSTLNHAAQTYAAELTARWRSLTNLYDTMILVCHVHVHVLHV
jgi:methyltransferase-like protein